MNMTIIERANSIYCPDKEVRMNFAEDMERIGYIRGQKEMLEIICKKLESLTYQDYPGGPMERVVEDYIIQDLRKEMEG